MADVVDHPLSDQEVASFTRQVTLSAAQKAIVTDWTTALTTLHVG
ncbi:hypothetical protein [Streptomyces sp. NPDC001604]